MDKVPAGKGRGRRGSAHASRTESPRRIYRYRTAHEPVSTARDPTLKGSGPDRWQERRLLCEDVWLPSGAVYRAAACRRRLRKRDHTSAPRTEY